MAGLFVASMAGAYVLTAKRTKTASYNLLHIGPISVILSDHWQPIDPAPGPWTQLLPASTVHGDPYRPTRQLVVSPVILESPTAPKELIESLMNKVIRRSAQINSQQKIALLDRHLVGLQLSLLEPHEQGVVQHLFVSVTSPQDGRTHAILYMQELISHKEQLADNEYEINQIAQSIHIPPPPEVTPEVTPKIPTE